MIENGINFRKKRELGEIITDSFKFLKQEIKPISRLLVIYVLPFIVIYSILQVHIEKKLLLNVDLNDIDMLKANVGPIYSNILMVYFFGLFVQSLLAATFYSFVEVYIKKGKGNFDLSEITPRLFANGLLALGASLVFFGLVFLGAFMFVVPGIYALNTFSLLVIIVIFERRGIANALARSWSLVNYKWWNTFAINLLALALILAINFILSLPALSSGINASLLKGAQTETAYPEWYWVLNGVSTGITTLLFIIPFTFIAFQYFNLDERTKPTPPPGQNALD